MLFHLEPAADDGRFAEPGPITPTPGQAFVHLCRQDQLDSVARRHFFGRVTQAVAIEESALVPGALKDEDLYGHGSFPHYYGAIPLEAQRSRRPLAPVVRSDVEAALPVIRRYFPPTPLVYAPRLSRRLNKELWLKLELVTPVRTFKLRGALHRVHAVEGPRPVVTASGGNHGLAVAWAARAFARPATVVVPERANPRKAEAIAALGARLVSHGVDYQAAYEHSLEIAAQQGAEHVHAYDDPLVVAGQGTVALELSELAPDAIFAGIGGGGLIGGLVAATLGTPGAPQIYGAATEGGHSMALSLRAGHIVGLEQVTTIADGLGARRPGRLAFALAQQGVREVLMVNDAALLEAARSLLLEECLVTELAGAAGLAAALAYPSRLGARNVVVLSGANASEATLAEITRPRSPETL